VLADAVENWSRIKEAGRYALSWRSPREMTDVAEDFIDTWVAGAASENWDAGDSACLRHWVGSERDLGC
jgi:hypothetical protein